MTKRLAALIAAIISFVVFLVVALWGATFEIDGNLSRSLMPGSTVPINIRISNPHFYPIVVSDVNVRIVRITPAHKGQTCSARNFTIVQAKPFRVSIAAFSSTTTRAIASRTAAMPSIRLTGTQSKLENGCQGAKIQLGYSASGTWWTR
jgi:hypothetical protein